MAKDQQTSVAVPAPVVRPEAEPAVPVHALVQAFGMLANVNHDAKALVQQMADSAGDFVRGMEELFAAEAAETSENTRPHTPNHRIG